ncbi:MAG: hypothetical protein IKP46_07155 [Bacteroidales bacterium]|nr:hypothetical protein [Bacteroidales bacterium]
MKRFLLILVAGIALVSCSERDASDIIILVQQYADTINAGEKADFLVNAFTTHEKIVRVTFSSFNEVEGAVDLGVVEPNVKNWNDHFYYEGPFLSKDTSTVRIKFIANDNLGNSVLQESKIVVISPSKDRLLENYSGLTIYSASHGSDDGFCLKTREPISSATADESEKDILLADDGSVSTATDVVFSLVSSFNYPKATRKMVEDMFAGLNHSVSLAPLKKGDIFFVGRKDLESGDMTAWGVFKVLAVYEESPGVSLELEYKYI